MRGRSRVRIFPVLLAMLLSVPAIASSGESASALPDEVIPIQEIPARPALIVEVGEDFLGEGNLDEGIDLGGWVLQPSFIVFGNLRSAVQSFEPARVHSSRVSEASIDLSLFANLYLTRTERILFGVRPFSQLDVNRRRVFTTYDLASDATDRLDDELNFDITHLFFEGDFGEIFAGLDKNDFRQLDVAFTLGRQPFRFQEGVLIDATLDGVGLTRNNIFLPGSSNARFSLLYARSDVASGTAANVFGLFSSADYPKASYDLDLIAVHRSEDSSGLGTDYYGVSSLHGGFAVIRRFGKTSATFRFNASTALEEVRLEESGTLLTSELAWTPPHGHDLIYFNSFLGIGRYRPAARSAGGPLELMGILFAGANLGNFGSVLDPTADDVAGLSLGYQKFLGGTRTQLVFELGGRKRLDRGEEGAAAFGVRYQMALGRRHVVRLDGFATGQQLRPGEDFETAFGGRFELSTSF